MSHLEPGVVYSNKGLRFWEAACLWYDGEKAIIQLRASLKEKEHYLGIVSKKELIAHEKVHAKRMHFNEPIFEEILAYQTSRSKFRRFFGPFFRTPRESLLYVIALFLVPFIPYLIWPFLFITSFGFVRLIRAQRIFARAKKLKPFAKLVEMTDQEIIAVAKQGR